MNTLTIKAAKAIKAIQRDGLINGGSRVLQGVYAMLKPVGRGQTLIMTGGTGDSARYRAFHRAEELTLKGEATQVCFQDNPFLSRFVDRFDKFIFHRVLYTGSVARMVNKIKKQNKEIIFDTDDLVFDKKYLQYMDYYRNMNRFERKLYENGVGGEFLLDSYVKECTTTTAFLADKLAKFGKNVTLAPNKLCRKDLLIVDNLVAKKVERDNMIKLGYFSGTSSHDKDFATIENALIEILQKHKNVQLVIVGPLTLSEKFQTVKDQIVRKPFVNRKKHFQNISEIDINLVPLEVGNPFCEAKSEIKYIEAGILGVPTVASATKTFEFIQNGINGFCCQNKADWREYLNELINSNEPRIQIGNKAQQIVKEIYI
jgi:O-antigen biosynthesis protein